MTTGFGSIEIQGDSFNFCFGFRWFSFREAGLKSVETICIFEDFGFPGISYSNSSTIVFYCVSENGILLSSIDSMFWVSELGIAIGLSISN